jgi:hypothetical protein
VAIAGNYRRALQRMEIGRPLPQATYLRDLLSTAVGGPDSGFSRDSGSPGAGFTRDSSEPTLLTPSSLEMSMVQPFATDTPPQRGGSVASDYSLGGAPGFATASGAVKPAAVGTKPRRRRDYSSY